jgi:hypothetical protein
MLFGRFRRRIVRCFIAQVLEHILNGRSGLVLLGRGRVLLA